MPRPRKPAAEEPPSTVSSRRCRALADELKKRLPIIFHESVIEQIVAAEVVTEAELEWPISRETSEKLGTFLAACFAVCSELQRLPAIPGIEKPV